MFLPGLSILFDTIDDDLHASLRKRLGIHGRDGEAEQPATLTLKTARSPERFFIDPPAPRTGARYAVAIDVDPDPSLSGHLRVRAATYTLAASFSTAGGEGTAVLASAEFDSPVRAAENIMRVATAWLALKRGGLLIHSASIVRDGRAYLFFGQSGSGKSTLSESSRRGQVVSDDLTLLLPGPGGSSEVVGAPFRGTYAGGDPVVGRYPVAAAFRLRKCAGDEEAVVEPLGPSAAMGGAIANAPFVADQLHARPDLFASLEKVLGSFPIRALRFRKGDDSFWEAIDAAGL